MATDDLFQIVSRYFPDLSDTQVRQFREMYPIYEDWNGKINVISRKDTENFYERHVLHSLAIAKVAQWQAGTRVVDVGTGGGFPGIPLAVLFPEVQFKLIDSTGKKIKVVEDVAQRLGLANVACAHIRAEDLNEKFDFVVSRAVAEAPTLYRWTQHLLRKKSPNPLANGYLLLKGGENLFEEFGDFPHFFHIYDLKEFFAESFFDTKKLVYMKMGS
jgi:16S rRNA (guanine527-N7)-methyltransferase